MDCPNCKRMRRDLINIGAMAETAIDRPSHELVGWLSQISNIASMSATTTPEERGETPLFTEIP